MTYKFLFLIICSSILTIGHSQPNNESFTAYYDIYKNNKSAGKLKRQLNFTDGIGTLTNRANINYWFFSSQYEEISHIQHINNTWRSINYQKKMTNAVKNDFESHQINWQKLTASGIKNADEQWETTLLPDIHYQDPLSYQWLLQHQLQQTSQKSLLFKVITRGRIKNYEFEPQKTMTLPTHWGTTDTIVIQRTDDTNKKITLWFAPKYQYHLVKATYQQKNDTITLLLTAVE